MDGPKLAELLVPVLGRHPEIAAAYLFGSVARGEATEASDLDIGLVFTRSPVPAARREQLSVDLGTEIALATGFERVDVVDLAAQGPIFGHRVLLEGFRLYEADRERRIDFESEVIVRAFDFEPTYRIATRGKAKALRRWLRERHDIRSDPDEARPAEDEPGQAR